MSPRARGRRLFPLAARVGVVLAVVTAFASAIHPYGAVKEQGRRRQGDGLPLVTDASAARVFSRSCANCHSNNTSWPWYSYVPPASWLIERDVTRGRQHFNLSSWPAYKREKQMEIVADIARVVANGEMPLPQYALLHRDARLSDDDRRAIRSWAGKQRRMLR